MRAASVLAAGLCLVGLAGCGVPIGDEPQAIDRVTSIPASTTPEPTPATSLSPTANTVTAFFMDGNRLTGYDFAIEGQPTVREALQFTLNGAPERAAELTSAIPAGTRLINVAVMDGAAHVDLTTEIGDISGEPQKQAFAQLVFTVLGDGGEVTSVLFSVEGEPISAPTDKGNLNQVHASDYQAPLNPR